MHVCSENRVAMLQRATDVAESLWYSYQTRRVFTIRCGVQCNYEVEIITVLSMHSLYAPQSPP